MANSKITSTIDGQEYDLTTNRIALGLLPKDVRAAMLTWPHGWEYWDGDVWMLLRSPSWSLIATYRACPAPKVTKHVLYWMPCCSATVDRNFAYDTHRIIIRYPGDTLPAGEYPGPDGAKIVVETLPAATQGRDG